MNVKQSSGAPGLTYLWEGSFTLTFIKESSNGGSVNAVPLDTKFRIQIAV